VYLTVQYAEYKQLLAGHWHEPSVDKQQLKKTLVTEQNRRRFWVAPQQNDWWRHEWSYQKDVQDRPQRSCVSLSSHVKISNYI
jgi:arylsulfatase A-like enzyme